MVSRRNAMLTTEDRRWLAGEKSYEGEHAKQQRYQRRRDIHERIYNSILDCTLLFEHLGERQRTELFADLCERDGRVGDDEFARGVRDALAFFLYSTGVVDAAVDGRTNPPALTLLEDAIYRAGRREGIVVEDVDLEITARDRTVSAIRRDLEAGAGLSPADVRLLLEREEVETEAVQECLRELLLEEE